MKDIAKVFHHCLKVNFVDEQTVTPVRFSDKRLGEYATRPRTPYSLCPASITMEFYTSQDKITFNHIMKPAQAEYITSDIFDVFEDDEFVCSVEPATYTGTFSYKKKKAGRVKLRIHLPIGVSVFFSDFDLGDWEPVEPAGKKALIYGDSISQGLFGRNPAKGYVPALAYSEGFDYLNASVGGDIYAEGDVDPENGYQPDFIFIARGINDIVYIKETEQILKNAEAMFQKIRTSYPDVPVAVMTGMWMGAFAEDFTGESPVTLKQTREITAGVRVLCEKFGYEFIDGLDIIPHEEEYYADICHPNNLGFEAMANNLRPYFQKYLK